MDCFLYDRDLRHEKLIPVVIRLAKLVLVMPVNYTLILLINLFRSSHQGCSIKKLFLCIVHKTPVLKSPFIKLRPSDQQLGTIEPEILK